LHRCRRRTPNGTDPDMQILNFGSLNIDHVYAVEHFARAGA
jgi:hypothetical protein